MTNKVSGFKTTFFCNCEDDEGHTVEIKTNELVSATIVCLKCGADITISRVCDDTVELYFGNMDTIDDVIIKEDE